MSFFDQIPVDPSEAVLFLQRDMDKNSVTTSKALEKHVPAGIESVLDEQYRPDDKDAFLDVYYPSKVKDALPTVVWIHGGAFISGDKIDIRNYAKILASYNYTAVSVGYSLAPKHRYPTPLFQVNDALAYLDKNALRLHIDSNRYFLSGDSAGAHIAAQLGAITTNPSYAEEMKIKPALAPQQVKGMVLTCGVYNANLPDYSGPAGKFLNPVTEAYIGKKDFLDTEAFKTLSVLNYVTKDFPQSFITVGNGDPLKEQTFEFNDKLASLGVKTVTLFYEQDHKPPLPHEYHFNLDIADGQNALAQIVAFLSSSSLTDTKWKLVEFRGKPVEYKNPEHKEIYLQLNSADKTVFGFSGCNTFRGFYELKGDSRIAFSMMASTLMACADMELETEFMKAIQVADNYNFDGKTLVLNRARMAPLARFEAMK